MNRREFFTVAAAAAGVSATAHAQEPAQPPGQGRAGGGRGGRGGGRGRGGPANVSPEKLARIEIMTLNHNSMIKLPWQEATPQRTLDIFDLPQYYVDVYGVRNVQFQSNHVAQDNDSPDLAYIRELRAKLDAAGAKAHQINIEIGTMAQMGSDGKAAALSGDAADIAATDRLALEMFAADQPLCRWIRLASERVAFQGLPARIFWLGYGERARFGLAINDLVRRGVVSAPIVIGRDHLDAGSVASPYRETEHMRDGSDAIADWPILNALLNTSAGATWVSVHHGGGVGIGYSIHAGMVVVADGSREADEKLQRVLTCDPGLGVVRHADAGYSEAVDTVRRTGITMPSLSGHGGSGR